MNSRPALGSVAPPEDAPEALTDHPVEEIQAYRQREKQLRPPVDGDRHTDAAETAASTTAITTPSPLAAFANQSCQS